ncbi:MAG TPA: hypothetical protein VF369_08815 [candidate division Zixibacteria bacterium]
MKKKYCLLFVIAIITIICALNYTNVQAGEVRSANTQTNVTVATVLKGASGCLQSSGWVAGPATKFCKSGPNGNGSWIYSNARGAAPWDAWVADSAHVWSDDWAIGLKGDKAFFLDAYDSIRVTMVSAGGNNYTVSITGKLSINYNCPNVRSGFEASIDSTHITQTPGRPDVFSRWALLQGSPNSPGYLLQTNIPSGSITITQPGGGWTVATFNYSTNIVYAGSPNDLEVYLKKMDWINYNPGIPTMTEIGIIILAVTLVITAIGLYWWRKRKQAAAIV